MSLFERLYSQGHEEVIYFSDPTCNLKAIVAIHNTTCQLLAELVYGHTEEEEALEDVLRLSKGMTYGRS